MFERKVVSGEVSPFLEQYRYYLALRGLTQDQYENFQNETLDVLKEVKENLNYILDYIKSNNADGYIADCTHLKEVVYFKFNGSQTRVPSRFLVSICDEVIKCIDNHIRLQPIEYTESTEFATAEVYKMTASNAPTVRLVEGVEKIAKTNEELRERFVRRSFNRQEMEESIKPYSDRNEIERYQVFAEIISEISDFSMKSGFDIADDDSLFLRVLYGSYINYMNNDKCFDAPKVETIRWQINHCCEIDPVVNKGILTLDELKTINLEVSESRIKRFFKIFKRKENKELYDKIATIINGYLETIINGHLENIDQSTGHYDRCDKNLRNLEKSLSWGKYKKAAEILSNIKYVIDSNISNNEKNRVVNEYLASQAKENSVFKFINSNILRIVDNESLQEEINKCSLLNIFYKCYKELKANKLSEEELIALINSNRTKIINFVSKLINILDSEPSLGTNGVTHSIEIDNFYECIKSNRELMEPELIDNVLKRMYIPHKA